MSGADIPLTLNRLPIEVIQAIATMLPLPHMKEFSCVNKKLRNVCLPFLFCQITLNFSEIEERDLRWIISSGLRHCVKSFTYVVPDLLSRDILSFDTFRSSSFTPHDYIEVIREPYDYHEAAAYPSYMTIYNSIRTICEEQHHIKDNHHDSTLLSSVFAALPRLKELRLSCVAMADCVDSHLILATKTDHSSYEHHFQVVATALRAARDQGIYIDVVELSGLDLPYYYGLPETQPRSAVKELLNDIKILRVHRCNHALLSFLSRCVLKIRQLDMCTLHLHERDVFHDLLQTNWIFLCLSGFTMWSGQLAINTFHGRLWERN
uniref:F-box protein DAS1 n=1 Tax=Talaromyces marneffei PM1 TaxID=1077442 RepID=A0A093X6C0_TALMA